MAKCGLWFMFFSHLSLFCSSNTNQLRFVFDLLVTVKSQVSVSFLTAKPSAGEGGGGEIGQQIEEEMDK